MSVHVLDNGVGIAANDIDKLFSRFGKLHRTAKLNNEGIGLGLTIVKQIVEASEGFIGVYSEGKGKGTLFYFTMKLPIFNANDENHLGFNSDLEDDKSLVFNSLVRHNKAYNKKPKKAIGPEQNIIFDKSQQQ